MYISSIRIFPSRSEESTTKAHATVIVNGQIILQSFRIIYIGDRMQIVYPTWHTRNGQIRTVVHPSGEFKAKLEEELLACYEKALENDGVSTFTYDEVEGDSLKITDAVIYPYLGRETAARARVALQLDGELWLRGMVLMAREDSSVWLATPRIDISNGQQMNLYHPLSKEARDLLTDGALPYYEEAVRTARKNAASRASVMR